MKTLEARFANLFQLRPLAMITVCYESAEWNVAEGRRANWRKKRRKVRVRWERWWRACHVRAVDSQTICSVPLSISRKSWNDIAPVSKRKEFTTRGDWKKKLEGLGGEGGGRRRPAGARQNLNPFKQLPHFAGVYNSWEAAPEGKHGKLCRMENIPDLSKTTCARKQISMEKG